MLRTYDEVVGTQQRAWLLARRDSQWPSLVSAEVLFVCAAEFL